MRNNESVRMEARGVRLHPALWERIDQAAKVVRLRPTDYLRRVIEDALSFDRDVPNQNNDVPTRNAGIQWKVSDE